MANELAIIEARESQAVALERGDLQAANEAYSRELAMLAGDVARTDLVVADGSGLTVTDPSGGPTISLREIPADEIAYSFDLMAAWDMDGDYPSIDLLARWGSNAAQMLSFADGVRRAFPEMAQRLQDSGMITSPEIVESAAELGMRLAKANLPKTTTQPNTRTAPPRRLPARSLPMRRQRPRRA